ncbi:hypothetical protein, partial [Stappia sp. TSB10GB4]|uniref:hypothetical protein n=1 Tax=Stappia sp. TSB10GB4 TaxID=2003584 RepID=UPI001AD8F2F4
LSGGINPVELEEMLGRVHADARNLVHWAAPSMCWDHHLGAKRRRMGAVHPNGIHWQPRQA